MKLKNVKQIIMITLTVLALGSYLLIPYITSLRFDGAFSDYLEIYEPVSNEITYENVTRVFDGSEMSLKIDELTDIYMDLEKYSNKSRADEFNIVYQWQSNLVELEKNMTNGQEYSEEELKVLFSDFELSRIWVNVYKYKD